jgi:D-beta-D-heptose 7-phosphate kinase/D-beta-D-heptose 1-phosphate adenosyltransferase
MEAKFKSLSDARQCFIVVGDFMLDIITHGSISKIANEAPIPVFKGDGKAKEQLGGAGNVCANLDGISGGISNSHIISAIGLVGDDAEAELVRDLLDNTGILNGGIITSPGRSTTCKHRYYVNNHLVFRSDTETTRPASAEEELAILKTVVADSTMFKNGGHIVKIILSDYDKGTLTDKLRQSIITYAQAEGIQTFVDPKTDLRTYYGCTLIKPNKTELLRLGGINVDETGLAEAHKQLEEKVGCKYSLITLAEGGMSLGFDSGPCHAAADKVEVIDVTGAGDVVLALITYMWGFDISHEQILKIANKVARKAVMHCGTYVMREGDAGERIVFTNGCFDILHVGHLRLLEEARKLGDRLIVGLNSDASVRRLKGIGRPIRSESERAEMLQALPWVDEVILFDNDTPAELIKHLRPAVLVKGGDYQLEDIVGREWASEVVRIPFVENNSSTRIIEAAARAVIKVSQTL